MNPEEKQQFIASIVEAIRHEDAQRTDEDRKLTGEEKQWIRLAIKREAQKAEVRQAIIEKTLAGLVWSAVVGFGAILWNFVVHNQTRG
jgi:hypothetical protein